jgi:hypothetical protein
LPYVRDCTSSKIFIETNSEKRAKVEELEVVRIRPFGKEDCAKPQRA